VGCAPGEDTLIGEGDTVRRPGKVIQVPVGPGLLGRVVDPLGFAGYLGPIEGPNTVRSSSRLRASSSVSR